MPLEVDTAIRQGLRVVPISPDGQVPAGLQSLLDFAPDSIEPIISAIDSERASAPTSALARLERSPSEGTAGFSPNHCAKTSATTSHKRARVSPEEPTFQGATGWGATRTLTHRGGSNSTGVSKIA